MFTAETIRVPGGRNQKIYRGGKGPTLVWLHGVSVVTEQDPVILELAKNFSVIAPVAPGYGDLAEIKELRDVHDLALYYDDVLDTLNLKGAAVAGHSFGAMIAAELAAHVPDRVGRLVLVSPLGLWNDNYPVADLFARPYPDIDALLWEGAGNKPAARNAIKESEQTVEDLVALAQGLTTVAQYIWPLPDKGLRRRLYRIKAQTLVVFGENDAFVPARYADDFTSGIAKAKSRIVPKASHMLPYENPIELADMVKKFLA